MGMCRIWVKSFFFMFPQMGQYVSRERDGVIGAVLVDPGGRQWKLLQVEYVYDNVVEGESGEEVGFVKSAGENFFLNYYMLDQGCRV